MTKRNRYQNTNNKQTKTFYKEKTLSGEQQKIIVYIYVIITPDFVTMKGLKQKLFYDNTWFKIHEHMYRHIY